jgi:hypothetical protein
MVFPVCVCFLCSPFTEIFLVEGSVAGEEVFPGLVTSGCISHHQDIAADCLQTTHTKQHKGRRPVVDQQNKPQTTSTFSKVCIEGAKTISRRSIFSSSAPSAGPYLWDCRVSEKHSFRWTSGLHMAWAGLLQDISAFVLEPEMATMWGKKFCSNSAPTISVRSRNKISAQIRDTSMSTEGIHSESLPLVSGLWVNLANTFVIHVGSAFGTCL